MDSVLGSDNQQDIMQLSNNHLLNDSQLGWYFDTMDTNSVLGFYYEIEKDNHLIKNGNFDINQVNNLEIKNCQTLGLSVCSVNNAHRSIEIFLRRGRILNQEKQRQLQIALKRHKQKAFEILKEVLPRGLTNKFIELLFNCKNLSIEQRGIVLKVIKEILLKFSKNSYSLISLHELKSMWYKLPLSIRNFLIGLMVLKIELIHLKLLEFQKEIIKRNKTYRVLKVIDNTISKDPREIDDDVKRDRWLKLGKLKEKFYEHKQYQMTDFYSTPVTKKQSLRKSRLHAIMTDLMASKNKSKYNFTNKL